MCAVSAQCAIFTSQPSFVPGIFLTFIFLVNTIFRAFEYATKDSSHAFERDHFWLVNAAF